jgi:SpoVK/Ycf46/Vps4 family AAA+-type ATPase
MTGADFYALCSDAMLHAIKRNIQRIQETGGEHNDLFGATFV